MKKMILYIKLLRVKHWLKNGLVILPAFFGGALLDLNIITPLIFAFLCFSACSSAIYIINDLCDLEKDRLHPVKCHRPLANGSVSKAEAIVLVCLSLAAATAFGFLTNGFSWVVLIPVIYFAVNLSYSLYFKNKAIIDIALLVSGFFLRVLYGSFVTGIPISPWLYLSVISISFFLAFGKRRNEKRSCGEQTRAVLEYYTESFLTHNLYISMALFIAFYAMWAIEDINGVRIWTVPLVIIILLRYCHTVERDAHGDPVNIIFSDKMLWLLGAIYIAVMVVLTYFPNVFLTIGGLTA